MNKKQKEFVKIYIALIVISFLFINWNTVSWIFNYRVMGTLVYDFFNPYPDSQLMVAASNIQLPPKQKVQIASEDARIYPYSEKSNSIEIPGIEITAPLVIGESTDKKVLEDNLNKGVVYYPGSVLPGQNGQIFVLGHSAPPGWPKIKYDWVFSKINDLNPGNEVKLYFNNRQYTYRVIRKDIVKPGDEVNSLGLERNSNILVLVSCWPPGKNYLRIAVQAQLVPAAALSMR